MIYLGVLAEGEMLSFWAVGAELGHQARGFGLSCQCSFVQLPSGLSNVRRRGVGNKHHDPHVPPFAPTLRYTNRSSQDKHAKNLAEKLAARLNQCVNKRQWDDTAYALSLLQHKNEEISKRVQEGYRVVEVGTEA
ncbi:hypothetical protein CLCR_03746 [Cladophialophora carrionii]|uniref:Uncharacterized protein n=1 Tax=Cladophialophora carrionii TaxID=86049 RepID=A0A1C1CGR5_9EURO|nr:hypothetical protein CLCR_03746 [Cladophialophora carrionii]